MSHRSQLTSRTHQSLLREEVTWLGTELTAHHILIKTGVTVDTYVAQVSLRSLCHAHLQVDGIAVDVDFGRIDAGEHVTVVVVEVRHRIIVFVQSLVQHLLVINITLLHTQQVVEPVGLIYGVTHPRDVAHEVLLAFVHLDIYVHMLLVEVADAILQNLGVAITILIVFFYEFLLIFLPALRSKLLRLEEGGKLASLVGLGKGTLREESTLDLAVREFLVTVDGNLMNLDLLFLVHDDIQNHLSLVSHVVALVNLDIGILESLVVEILLGENLGTVEHVRGHLCTLHHTQLLLHILTLTLLQAHIVDVRDTRAHSQIDVQIELLANDGVGSDSNL